MYFQYIHLKRTTTTWSKRREFFNKSFEASSGQSHRSTKNGIMIVVGQLGVISEVIFCVESESEVRIGPSRQDFEIFEVIYSKNGFLGYF